MPSENEKLPASTKIYAFDSDGKLLCPWTVLISVWEISKTSTRTQTILDLTLHTIKLVN